MSCLLVLVCLGLAGLACATEIDPIPKGPYEVGSTNLEVIATPPNPVIEYMQGGGGWFSGPRYIDQILAHPEATFHLDVEIPRDSPTHGRLAGTRIPVTCYIVYPTTKDNPRPSYTFPYKDTGDNVFPHMQAPGETPLFAEPGARYPVILFSHGYTAHGLWELDRYKRLASHGYIVVSIFHGDKRHGFLENFSIRPVMVSQVLDRLLADPSFGKAIDPEAIGVSGGSLGGHTVAALLGARDPLSPRSTLADPRIKAGFMLVPHFGAALHWPFGKDMEGTRFLARPVLAVYSEKDENNARSIRLAAHTSRSPITAVILPGEGHLVGKQGWNDIPTWELLFFNAELKHDAKAQELLRGDLHVKGGAEDQITDRSPGS
jgi:hypothetical protein